MKGGKRKVQAFTFKTGTERHFIRSFRSHTLLCGVTHCNDTNTRKHLFTFLPPKTPISAYWIWLMAQYNKCNIITKSFEMLIPLIKSTIPLHCLQFSGHLAKSTENIATVFRVHSLPEVFGAKCALGKESINFTHFVFKIGSLTS